MSEWELAGAGVCVGACRGLGSEWALAGRGLGSEWALAGAGEVRTRELQA